jgi:tetratricopeptide (TPR) repeat protein
MKDGTDLMRFIRIADIEMPETILVNTKLFNLRKDGTQWTGGWKHAMSETNRSYRPNGFNTLYECVAPGQKGLGSIAMAGKAFEVLAENSDKFISHKTKKVQLLEGDIRGLFHIINQVTKGYLQKEKAFFEKYSAERSEELTDNVNALLDMIPDDDSYCLLKMSAGVGFHSITGDWQYEDYDQTGIWTENRNAGKKKYKSRKTAEDNGRLQLMGFVKLRALNAEESSKREESLHEEHVKIKERIMASVRERKAAKMKQQEEEQKRRIAREEELIKQKTCQEFLKQIQSLYNNNRWDEAISKAEEALAFDPDNADFETWFKKCKKAKDLEDYRKSEEVATAQRFSQPLAEVIKGKSSAGNLIGTTVKWVKTEGNTFGQTECDAFIAAAQLLPSKEMKKLNSELSDLAKVVDQIWIEKIKAK